MVVSFYFLVKSLCIQFHMVGTNKTTTFLLVQIERKYEPSLLQKSHLEPLILEVHCFRKESKKSSLYLTSEFKLKSHFILGLWQKRWSQRWENELLSKPNSVTNIDIKSHLTIFESAKNKIYRSQTLPLCF